MAVDEAKVRLNLAISPGTWLMPSDLLINTQSTIGYNNKLRKATAEMKLGVNNTINSDTKPVGIKLMDGGKSKIKRLSSNPIHQGVQQKNENLTEHQSKDETGAQTRQRLLSQRQVTAAKNSNHEVTKVGVFISAAVSAFVIDRIL